MNECQLWVLDTRAPHSHSLIPIQLKFSVLLLNEFRGRTIAAISDPLRGGKQLRVALDVVEDVVQGGKALD